MTTDNEAFEKWFDVKKNEGYFYEADRNVAETCYLILKADSAQEANKLLEEIAELKARWMQARADRDHAIKRWDELSKENIELQAEIAELKQQAQEHQDDVVIFDKKSLASFENEVIEKCAKVCDELGSGQGWTDIASRKIRALKHSSLTPECSTEQQPCDKLKKEVE